ncbi:enoyl-CoA hydratase [Sulfolobus sp. A20]|uniref:enoyl-CoA hydratase/isomerase family protein n=1 Tax=Saccharolobus sp. A20 TaxID=1891280 RepID=UPI0008460651|nr:enoyl-CoA hydratase/isomerase family protein [Sulfolobus sp. A20]TRM73620.1 enoyl-CoA hydratase/isomerase family protein [Sulfolobus sp. B5]TRM76743.1 enoyl-CoA hydratase/isomerase family protein [Sulfolobus sp. E5]TRM78069.1 enoyl-CoA hydratase/isomerase family protein [Sulfolobus sp. A20-N-F8]TRM82406.1 enoyl-CoA hydratase/isomerase family protein [Sulfolobus sp. D5]TRM88779.1 enoyl-CoA hydratase/isomerase family protein [Sulfolobus sp. C3]TRN00935.1 enoyl-CoA hydratase/isomerase family 
MGLKELSPKYFKIEVEDNVGIIKLNRPPANAHNLEMLRELDNIIVEARFDDSVKALLVTSNVPRFFSAGFDINEIKEKPPEYIGLSSQFSKEVMLRMMSTKKLIIASINGHCMGGGLELALACDLRFGANSEEIKIGMPEVANLALIPGEGGTQFLARIVGRSKAIYLMTTGKTLTPKEAYELGLLDRLVEPEKLFEESFNFARQVAKGPALAVGFAKLAVNEGMDLPLYSAFALEREMQNQALASEDAKEGAKAFFEKRKPIFKGK